MCACGRDNHSGRRYCGGCGIRIGASCARCRFENAHDDRHCGGCGDALAAAATPSPPGSLVRPTPAPAPAEHRPLADTMSADELATLIGIVAAPQVITLPAAVSQDDLDRLFGDLS